MRLYLTIISIILFGMTGVRAYELNHPCLLHTEADFEYVKAHIGEEPFASALTKLKQSQYCSTNYKPSPVEYLARLDANNWKDLNSRWENAGIAHLWYSGIHNNYTQFMRDAAAAYQLALLYRIEGSNAAANAAKNILTQWANTNKGILVNKNGEIIDPNERLIMFQPYQMAVAAEMLRDYNGWGDTNEFGKVVEWMDNSFYWVANAQLQLQNESGGGHYWMNWDLASMATVLAIGILADKRDYIDQALDYYKGKGGGPGNILKGVPYLHPDPDSDEILGQGNELGRDQGHNTLCAAVLGTFCRMGEAIGEDLFAYDDYRALKFAEYVAKYNLAQEWYYPNPMQNFPSMKVGESDSDFEYPHASFPFRTYTYGDGGTMTEPSQASRGQVRPGWDYWVGYANSHGLEAAYSTAMAERIRPDGGGGQYSTNSGGFDQIGFSTLMGYRDFVAPEMPDEVDFECVADTWVRQDSPTVKNGGSPKIELRRVSIKDDNGNVTGGNYHAGLLTFKFNLPEERRVEEATLCIVTERVKGGDVSVFPYESRFDENSACWNTEGSLIEAATERVALFTAAGQKGKAIYDTGIIEENRTIDAWTNRVDVTDYVAALAPGTKSVGFLLRQESDDQVCFFSKDNQGQEKAFNDTDATTNLASSQLKPYLFVKFADVNDMPTEPPTDDDEENGDGEKDDVSSATLTSSDRDKAEYYDITGAKRSEPAAGGVYIVKTGKKIEKRIIK